MTSSIPPMLHAMQRYAGIVCFGLLLLLGMGLFHGHCEEEGESADSTHVLVCKCSCHHPPMTPQTEVLALETSPETIFVAQQPQQFIPEAVVHGIFRPPQPLV